MNSPIKPKVSFLKCALNGRALKPDQDCYRFSVQAEPTTLLGDRGWLYGWGIEKSMPLRNWHDQYQNDIIVFCFDYINCLKTKTYIYS